MMPRLDGFGLLRGVARRSSSCATVPVILLSARAGEEARVEGVDAGADDYLAKPFSARELLARVGANLAMARLRREAMEALRGVNETLEARVAERTRERDSIWRLSRDLMVVVQAEFDRRWRSTRPGPTMLGWEESELLGQQARDLVHPDDRAATASRRWPPGAMAPDPVSFENRAAPPGRHLSLDRLDGGAERGRALCGRPRRDRRAGDSRSGCGRRRRWRRSAS